VPLLGKPTRLDRAEGDIHITPPLPQEDVVRICRILEHDLLPSEGAGLGVNACVPFWPTVVIGVAWMFMPRHNRRG
jgi:hypothetical protein